MDRCWTVRFGWDRVGSSIYPAKAKEKEKEKEKGKEKDDEVKQNSVSNHDNKLPLAHYLSVLNEGKTSHNITTPEKPISQTYQTVKNNTNSLKFSTFQKLAMPSEHEDLTINMSLNLSPRPIKSGGCPLFITLKPYPSLGLTGSNAGAHRETQETAMSTIHHLGSQHLIPTPYTAKGEEKNTVRKKIVKESRESSDSDRKTTGGSIEWTAPMQRLEEEISNPTGKNTLSKDEHVANTCSNSNENNKKNKSQKETLTNYRMFIQKSRNKIKKYSEYRECGLFYFLTVSMDRCAVSNKISQAFINISSRFFAPYRAILGFKSRALSRLVVTAADKDNSSPLQGCQTGGEKNDGNNNKRKRSTDSEQTGKEIENIDMSEPQHKIAKLVLDRIKDSTSHTAEYRIRKGTDKATKLRPQSITQFFYNPKQFALKSTVYSKTTKQQPLKDNPITQMNSTPETSGTSASHPVSQERPKISLRQAKTKKKNLEKKLKKVQENIATTKDDLESINHLRQDRNYGNIVETQERELQKQKKEESHLIQQIDNILVTLKSAEKTTNSTADYKKKRLPHQKEREQKLKLIQTDHRFRGRVRCLDCRYLEQRSSSPTGWPGYPALPKKNY